jgi:carboxylate-amine ligase
MSASPPLPAFAGFGIELEYMVVDRLTLSILPIADSLLRKGGIQLCELERSGNFGWSNELVLHLIEIKNMQPVAALEPLALGFHEQVRDINALLGAQGAQLMPTGMHPWMNPRTETRLWPHDNAEIYRGYDRVFDCRRGHGWANLQSMHVNLPFASDEEFARLHAAIRLVLPILPALAASSPIAEGRPSGWMDFRLEGYRTNALRIPSSTGRVIPDTIDSPAEYRERILTPLYREIAPLDPGGVLQHEWLNSRGVIPRFNRSALEIRVIDLQECPAADLAIAAVTISVVQALYDGRWSPLATQRGIATEALVAILHACMRDADLAVIDNRAYLDLFGFSGVRCEARELWSHLVGAIQRDTEQTPFWQQCIATILEQGTLARRILRALGPKHGHPELAGVYSTLCTCLQDGRMFTAQSGALQ